MDIDLLSKMVRELILDREEVTLPGLGTFVAELIPSSFSDRGYTINPPYKRLGFRQRENAEDDVLVDFYSKNNNVDKEKASRIITEFLAELKQVLEQKKSVVFPGLGRLRATRENNFFFVADEDLDIYPEGFGLEPVSLKTHEETPAEVSATMAALHSILNPEPEVPVADNPADNPADISIETDPNADSGGTDVSETAPATGIASPAMVASIAAVSEGVAEASDAVGGGQAEHKEDGTANPADIQDDAAGNSDGGNNEDTAVEAQSDGAQSDEPKAAESEENNDSEPEPQAESPAAGDVSGPCEAQVGATENPESAGDDGAETEPQTADPAEGVHAEPAATRPRRTFRTIAWIIGALLILAILVVVVFVILAHTSPEFIDSILYTPEELEIINS